LGWILAIGLINEALDEGDTKKTLQALQIPAAKLEGVTPEVAQHYQDTLLRAKREKAQVSTETCLYKRVQASTVRHVIVSAALLSVHMP
uniref:Uncharacterized protein n=1 Tax=Crocodylus porosus TaxID=8502 RepID=A0A7M4E8X8_CROPO